MSESLSIRIIREHDYRFTVDFGEAFAALSADLPPPLGQADGPSPEHLLAAAVANCLSASLVFALRKFKQEPGKMETVVTCTTGRNEQNRIRVTGMEAVLNLGCPAENLEHLERILGQFEDFCTVSQSVQSGIPLTIHVEDSTGKRLK
ncbi:putative OsmC-like protein [Fluviicoccus keumensis]|uniref:Putative OsmC-like protein n=1 Tax=Fluviicoccus keumensis TaxID=1435465 RepID=A0A4V2G3G5_9GAMM|nr:OsmC family protein [Fluviicoccus keumensis]RZU36916.1 putative OsmC-like protein [Fluviicoccus keumensis]